MNAVPGYIRGSVFEWFSHLWCTIASLYTSRETVNKRLGDVLDTQYKLTDTEYLYGYSSRSLFHACVDGIKNRYGRPVNIVTTPFLHTGFQRIINWTGSKGTYLDLTQYQPSWTDDQLANQDLLLITHVFGNPFEIAQLVSRFRELNPEGVVVEDCVQAGFISNYTGSRLVDLALFSAGQDKIPVGFGGGIGIFRNHQLYSQTQDQLLSLPVDGWWSRFTHLLFKIVFIILYNFRPVIWLFKLGLRMLCISPTKFTVRFRKKVPGFVHSYEKYYKQPSVSQLLSIEKALVRDYSVDYFTTISKREQFIHGLGRSGSNYLPWRQVLDYPTSSNYYNHIYVENKDLFTRLMDKRNMIVVDQQSWYVDESSPTAKRLQDRMMLIPVFCNYTPERVHRIGKLLNELAHAHPIFPLATNLVSNHLRRPKPPEPGFVQNLLGVPQSFRGGAR